MLTTLCERVAAPLVELHRKATPVSAVVVLGMVALSILGYGLAVGNDHLGWFGALLTATAWYGFLLSGCGRLLAAKDRQILELQDQRSRKG